MALSDEERHHISNHLNDFTEPCQITAIWIAAPTYEIEFQTFIVTHLEEVADKQITIYGPIAPANMKAELVKVLQDPKWQAELPRGSSVFDTLQPSTYKEQIAIQLASLYRSWKWYVLAAVDDSIVPNMRNKPAGRLRLSGKDFTFEVWGNITHSDVQEEINRIIEDAKSSTHQISRPQVPPERPEQKPKDIESCGALVYPPVWLGSMLTLTSEQEIFPPQLRSVFYNAPPITVASYETSRLFFYQFGLILVDTDTDTTALQIINEFLAALAVVLPDDLPVHSVTEQDLMHGNLTSDKLIIGSLAWQTESSRSQLMDKELVDRWWERKRPVVTEEQIGKAVDLACKARNTRAGTAGQTLLQAVTHFSAKDYTSSFILAWATIEQWLEYLWDNYLAQKGVTGNRKSNLNNSRNWTVHHFIETLNLANVIGDGLYKALDPLRRKRNTIVHDAIPANEQETLQCLTIARQGAKQLFNDLR